MRAPNLFLVGELKPQQSQDFLYEMLQQCVAMQLIKAHWSQLVKKGKKKIWVSILLQASCLDINMHHQGCGIIFLLLHPEEGCTLMNEVHLPLVKLVRPL